MFRKRPEPWGEKERAELRGAASDLFLEIVKALRIDKIAYWLASKKPSKESADDQ